MNVCCDSHIHVVGPIERYPQVANRTYTAGLALLADIQRTAAARDVRRFVIVQPSFYGTDNTVTLESLDALAGFGRGVAVIDPKTVSTAALKDFAARGVRGLRINLYSPLGASMSLVDRFTALETVAHDMRWHIEVIAPLKMLAVATALLGRSRVPVVVDHYGLHAGFTPVQPESRALLDLLRLPHVWMKLSAPYRASDDAMATRPDPAWLTAILGVAADRCVWGSDWPHTPTHESQGDQRAVLPYRSLRYETVIDDFTTAVGSAELAARILSENPARLYDFAS